MFEILNTVKKCKNAKNELKYFFNLMQDSLKLKDILKNIISYDKFRIMLQASMRKFMDQEEEKKSDKNSLFVKKV